MRNATIRLIQIRSDRSLGLLFKPQVRTSMKSDSFDRQTVDSDANKLSGEEKKHTYEKPRTRTQTNMKTICKHIPVAKNKAPQKVGRPYWYWQQCRTIS